MIPTLILLSILTYCIFTVIIILKVINSNLLSKKQKAINISLSILIPFIWGILMFVIFGPSTKGTGSKERKKEQKLNRGWNEPSGSAF